MCFSKIKTRKEYEAMASYIFRNVHFNKDNDMDLKIFKDGLRNQIFDMASIEIGLVSKKAIESGKKKSELTKEHIYPRNRQAIKLINMVLEGATVDEVREELIKSCQVVITTKDENIALVPLQKEEDYDWRKGYEKLGIELVEYSFPSNQKYVYKVDEIEYNSLSKVAEAHGISQAGADYRFRSTSKKMKGWTRHEAESQSTSASC